MDESDLKRALLKSLRAQGGVGFRIEDRYAVGRPDCFMHPEAMPPFFVEAKMLRDRAALFCTEQQRYALEELDRPPFIHAVLVGFSARHDALYIGRPGDKLSQARYVPRPARFDSADWWITELLGKWHHDWREKAAAGAAREAGAGRAAPRGSESISREPHARLRRGPPIRS